MANHAAEKQAREDEKKNAPAKPHEGFIVWDTVNHIVVAGPEPTKDGAERALERRASNSDARHTDNTSKDHVERFTVESVTLA